MLSKSKILKSTPVFLENWTKEEDVYDDFEVFGFKKYRYDSSVNPKKPKNIKILFAYYTYEDYSGDAFVLFYNKTNKKLYEVHGGHCSCYGLEGQWYEEEINLKELENRLNKGDSYNGWFIPLKAFLKI